MTLMKLRLKGAQKGHSLLKKKADALTVRFRQILKKIIEVWSLMNHYRNVIFTTEVLIITMTAVGHLA